MQYHCNFCNKEYKIKSYLEKHVNLCRLIKQSTPLNDSIVYDTPSNKRMYEMLLELGNKYKSLENKIDTLNKLVIKKKKKINICQWLNETIALKINFHNFVEKICIQKSDVEKMINTNIYDTFDTIFSKFKSSESISIPIFSFIQNSNIIYVFDRCDKDTDPKISDENNNYSAWFQLSTSDLKNMLLTIKRKLSSYALELKKNEEIHEDAFDKLMIKIVNVDFKSISTINKYKQLLYSHLKTDIKYYIEYEFEF